MIRNAAGSEDPTASAAPVFAPGATIGRYRIEAAIGAGGMGEVFRARDTQLGRAVAIKTSSALFQARVQIEARAISALNHPHICTLYDAGPNYLVMELVEGSSLAARLQAGPLPQAEALAYAVQIAQALGEAHAHGIVHRDLKPGNIMLTRHGVKVLDFGLARILEETAVTEIRTVLGTPAYMAPEQAHGGEASPATDFFAFGLVLYEMLAGSLPLPGASLGSLLASGIQPRLPPLAEQRSGLPSELDRLTRQLLAADPAQRPPSAVQVEVQLSALLRQTSPAHGHDRLRWWTRAGAIAFVVLLLAGAWLYRRLEQTRWVREVAIPQITPLSAQQPLAAFLFLRRAEAMRPGDPQLAALQASTTRLVSIASDPVGATIQIQDYLHPGDWLTLGRTPLNQVRVPDGYLRWRVSKAGLGAYVSAPFTTAAMQFPLAQVQRLSPAGMVPVPGGTWGDMIGFIGWIVTKLPSYEMGRYEVTNAQFQRFVDQGGYQKPQYWSEPFILDSKPLTFAQAMARFRDRSARPGPATWDAGHFPPGQADFPVTGVSWYEAAAYANFAGQDLPVLAQFYDAAPEDAAFYAANAGNFAGVGPHAVGTSLDVGPFGTYDMAGNVREWSRTAIGDQHFILGGAWGTQPYQAVDPESLPSFDRSPMNGFRTVRNSAPLPAQALASLSLHGRDFSRAQPASDAAFDAYKAMYAYEPVPLDPQADGPREDAPDWTKQRFTIDAGHDGARLPLYLFLPKHVAPPFQAVVFFPSARVETMTDSHHLGDMQFVDYVIKSGRALVYPIYLGTYERPVNPIFDVGAIGDLQMTIQRSKEVRRAFDYLASRADIDTSKVAYVGVSMGSAYGVIFATLEPRFRTAVFLDGGFFQNTPAKGRDQVDFAPRLKMPVLMVNGKYDFTFPPTSAQEPMFRLLGAAPADKKRVVLDAPHDVSQQKLALSQAVLAWLDKYLGPIAY